MTITQAPIGLKMQSWRVRGLAVWLFVDPFPMWAAIGLPTLLLLVCCVLGGRTERSVRSASYGVTLLGVLLVAYGLSETRQLFGRPSIKERITAWALRLLPLIQRRKIVIGVGGSSIGIGVGTARISVRSSAPDTSLSKRLAALERNFEHLEHDLSSAERRLENSIQQVRNELSAEQQERRTAHVEVNTRLESFVLGGFDFELVGLAWVIAGQFLSTFPTETAALLAR